MYYGEPARAGSRLGRRIGRWSVVLVAVAAIFASRQFVAQNRRQADKGQAGAPQKRERRAAATPQQSLTALVENRLPTRLVRMIAFDPETAPELAIGRLKTLGRPDQKFIFVGDYDELRGETVEMAVLKVGGKLQPGQHVSAIIFPVAELPLYPANARGMLQVIRELDRELPADSPQSALVDLEKYLPPEALAALDETGDRAGAWKNYSLYYEEYARAVAELRTAQAPVLKLIGNIDHDWHPLGYAQAGDELQPPAPDLSVDLAGRPLAVPRFGARVFLVANGSLADLSGQCLIDFTDPQQERIPELDFNTEECLVVSD